MKTTIHLILVLAFAAAAGDWPQFKRSPNRQGCALNEQIALPSKLCAWFDFGSPLRSSPAVVNGHAYALSDLGLLARINLSTNKVDWAVNLGGAGNESSPAVGNGKVYVGTTAGKFYVLDEVSGAILNQIQTGGPIFAAPLLLSGGVYFGSFDGKFYALDLNGGLKWSFQAKLNIVFSAAESGGQIVFSDGDNNLYWLTDQGNSYGLVHTNHSGTFISPPVIWNGGVYVGRGNQEYGTDVHCLTKYDFSTGLLDSSLNAGGVRTALSVDTATSIFFVGSTTGGLYSKKRGATSLGDNWTSATAYNVYPSGVFGVNSSPAVIGNCVVFGSEQGGIHFYKKDGVNWPNNEVGVPLWTFQPASGAALESSPAVSDGRVVIGGTDGYLYGFWNGTEVTQPVTVTPPSTVREAVGAGRWTLRVAPNPSAGGRIRFDLSIARGPASLKVYDVRGSLVFESRALPRGRAAIEWNGRDLEGRPLAAGSYVAQVREFASGAATSFALKILR